MQRKVVIAGGTGFLGQAVARDLSRRGWTVVVLGREPKPPAHGTLVLWDGKTLGPWEMALEGADAVINLAGKNIAAVHNDENRKQILESRLDSVRALGAAVRHRAQPPRLWLQASAVAIYGNPGAQICDETTPAAASSPSESFLTAVTKRWEAAFASEASPARKITLRTGIVLGRDGGALQPLIKLAKAFLGGSAGDGRQYLSWIHLEDYCAICRWALEGGSGESASASGERAVPQAYNLCAPQPVTNEDFMKELRHALHRPWSPPAPAWAVKFGAEVIMRADSSLILTGQRVLPRRLKEAGFPFAFPQLRVALKDLVEGGA